MNYVTPQTIATEKAVKEEVLKLHEDLTPAEYDTILDLYRFVIKHCVINRKEVSLFRLGKLIIRKERSLRHKRFLKYVEDNNINLNEIPDVTRKALHKETNKLFAKEVDKNRTGESLAEFKNILKKGKRISKKSVK